MCVSVSVCECLFAKYDKVAILKVRDRENLANSSSNNGIHLKYSVDGSYTSAIASFE